jgi:hypothetical protein
MPRTPWISPGGCRPGGPRGWREEELHALVRWSTAEGTDEEPARTETQPRSETLQGARATAVSPTPWVEFCG